MSKGAILKMYDSSVLENHKAAQAVLGELHREALKDQQRWQQRTGHNDAASNSAGGGDLVRLGEFYLAVSEEEGAFLNIIARAMKARRIVEFGASFGVSSIYLGAAALENGGFVTTTEVHPEKCASLRKTFERAELSNVITLLEGDARETLADVEGPIDLLFLDGWKSMYLPIYNLLRPKIPPGGIILADNCSHQAAADYLATVRSKDSGCQTVIKADMAMSYVTS